MIDFDSFPHPLFASNEPILFHFTNIAFPRFLLFVKEIFNSIISDVKQILNHAHSVPGLVSFIYCFQSVTWKALAFKIVSNFIIGQFGTIFSQISTSLVSRSTAWAVRHFNAPSFNVILHCQIASADCTVHSTK